MWPLQAGTYTQTLQGDSPVSNVSAKHGTHICLQQPCEKPGCDGNPAWDGRDKASLAQANGSLSQKPVESN